MRSFYKLTKTMIESLKTEEAIKITHIGDLHRSHLTKDKEQEDLVKFILEGFPHYIVISGDTIDSTQVLEDKKTKEDTLTFLDKVSIVPTILGLGSHDYDYRVSKKISKSGWQYKFPHEFWDNVGQIKNVHLLHNSIYQDERICFVGYTQPHEYYFNEHKGEDVTVMIRDLQILDFARQIDPSKLTLANIHSPELFQDPSLAPLLRIYDLILSGHMHNGCVPPLLDEIWKSNTGLIEPQKKIIAKNARGMFNIGTEEKPTLVNVTGGIVKIQESAPKVLQPFNKCFPMSIDELTITKGPKTKIYSRSSSYYFR